MKNTANCRQVKINRFKRYSLKLLYLIIASFFLSLVWIFWFKDPFLGTLNSDHVVPFIMTQVSWAKQDFYYWGASRFGSVYVIFFKSFISPFFGKLVQLFYFIPVFLFFISYFLCLLRLQSIPGKIFWAILMLPVIPLVEETFLFPGHLYGMLFCLNALQYFLLTKKENSHFGIFFAGVISGITYWQHELSGCIWLCLSFLYLHSFYFGNIFPLWNRKNILLFSGFFPVFFFAEVFRIFSKSWAKTHSHYDKETLLGFIDNLREFSTHGLSFHHSPFFGIVLVLAIILSILFLIISMSAHHSVRFRGKFRFFFPEREYSDSLKPGSAEKSHGIQMKFSFFYLIICVLSILLIQRYSWYAAMGNRDDRYFSFLVPFAIFFLIRIFELAPAFFSRTLFIFLLLLVIESVRLEAPIFISDSLKKTREDRIQKYNSISSVIKENGCRSYIGLYWESYVLFPFLQDRIPVSASDAIRNPVLFGEALVARPLCLAKGGNLEYLRGKIDVSSCSQTQDLIICR